MVVATGGLSIPKIGATSFGYDLARQFGLAIREPWPALVPLLLSAEDCSHYCDLAGVSAVQAASGPRGYFQGESGTCPNGKAAGPGVVSFICSRASSRP